MALLRILSILVLALGLVLGGPAAAQQTPDTVALPSDMLPADVLPPAPDSAALPTPETTDAAAEQPPLEQPAAQQPTAEPQQQPVASQQQPAAEPQQQPVTDQPQQQPAPPPAERPAAAVDGEAVTDSLAAELATLRAAVLGLALQRDSLVRALAQQPGRVDTVVVRDTTRGAAQETVDELAGTARNALENFVPKLIVSLILVILTLYLVRGFEWLLEALALQSAERELFYKKLIPIIRLLVWAFTIYLIIAAVFDIPASSLLAAATAVGVAIGFAAQEVLKNIFGGIVIILDQPFQVGDKISVGGTYGTVTAIGLRSTRMVTPDDNLVSVPNSQVVADQVSNANAGELSLQVVTDLYIPGWMDVSLAKRIAYEAAANSRYVYLEKPIVVIVKDEFRETFLTHLKVKAYVLDRPYEFLLMSDITEAAKAEFLRHGLLVPMPIGVEVDVDVDYDNRGARDGRDDAPANGTTVDAPDGGAARAETRPAEPPARDA